MSKYGPGPDPLYPHKTSFPTQPSPTAKPFNYLPTTLVALDKIYLTSVGI